MSERIEQLLEGILTELKTLNSTIEHQYRRTTDEVRARENFIQNELGRITGNLPPAMASAVKKYVGGRHG